MKKKFYPEGRFNEILRIKQNNYLAERLKLAKPVINSTCPESFEFFKKDIPKSHEKGNLSKSFSKIILSQILFFSEKHL